MGRKPLGNEAMSGAERQARYREAHAAGAPRVRYRRPADRRSRAERWRQAVRELGELQLEYDEWRQSMPDSLAETPLGLALTAICELDLSELEAIEPPLGYGRD